MDTEHLIKLKFKEKSRDLYIRMGHRVSKFSQTKIRFF